MVLNWCSSFRNNSSKNIVNYVHRKNKFIIIIIIKKSCDTGRMSCKHHQLQVQKYFTENKIIKKYLKIFGNRMYIKKTKMSQHFIEYKETNKYPCSVLCKVAMIPK